MKKQKYYVTYTPDETRIVLYALNRLRNNLLEEGREPACVAGLPREQCAHLPKQAVCAVPPLHTSPPRLPAKPAKKKNLRAATAFFRALFFPQSNTNTIHQDDRKPAVFFSPIFRKKENPYYEETTCIFAAPPIPCFTLFLCPSGICRQLSERQYGKSHGVRRVGVPRREAARRGQLHQQRRQPGQSL